MTDGAKLDDRIAASGLKKTYIADQMGISIQTLINKIANRTEFTASEVKRLCDILGIDSLSEKETIFFADKVI